MPLHRISGSWFILGLVKMEAHGKIAYSHIKREPFEVAK